MKTQPKSTLVISGLFLLMLLVTACAPSSSPEFPTGKFVSKSNELEGYYFYENSTWAYFTFGEIGAQGEFSVKGDEWTNKGDESCPFSATYKWTFDGTNLAFTLVGEDECEPRQVSTDGQTFVLAP